MAYTNPILTVFGLVCLLLLSACGTSPTQQSGNINPKARAANVPDSATQEYQQVLAAIDSKNWDSAERLLLEMQSTYPRLLSLKATLGWVYWQAGKMDKALAELEPLVKRRLYKSDAHNYLAIIYRQQGQFTQAESLYKDALKIWSGDPVLHKNLGILYELYLGRLDDALTHYRKAQVLNQGDKKLRGWIKDLERRTK